MESSSGIMTDLLNSTIWKGLEKIGNTDASHYHKYQYDFFLSSLISFTLNNKRNNMTLHCYNPIAAMSSKIWNDVMGAFYVNKFPPMTAA